MGDVALLKMQSRCRWAYCAVSFNIDINFPHSAYNIAAGADDGKERVHAAYVHYESHITAQTMLLYYWYICKKNVIKTNANIFCPQTGIINADCINTPYPNPIIINQVFTNPYTGDNAMWKDIHDTSMKKIVQWVADLKCSYSTALFCFFPW